MTSRLGTALGAVLLVLAVLLAIVGVLYLHDTAKELPSFLPGAAKHGKYHETHKAIAALVAAAVLALAAAVGIRLTRGRA